MKNLIFILIFLCCILPSASAQQDYVADNSNMNARTATSTITAVSFRFEAIDQSSYVNQVDSGLAGKHFLGDIIAKKQYLLKKMYSYKEPVAPGSSATKTIYRKPNIYFSVKKIEKYLKEYLKNNQLNTEASKENFNKVLDVALNILEEDTESFERRINSANGNASSLLKIFVNEVELNM